MRKLTPFQTESRLALIVIAVLISITQPMLRPADAQSILDQQAPIAASPAEERVAESHRATVVTPSRSFPSLAQQPTSIADEQITGDAAKGNAEKGDLKKHQAMATPLVTVCSSLAVVLGLFAGFVWLTRRFGNGATNQRVISKEVVQALGSTSIDPRTKVTLIRCGNRIIVMAQTATAIYPLSEITDPEEVRHLTASCTGTSVQSFASTLRELEREPAEKGFLGHPASMPTTPSPHAATAGAPSPNRGRLFANA